MITAETCGARSRPMTATSTKNLSKGVPLVVVYRCTLAPHPSSQAHYDATYRGGWTWPKELEER